VTSIGRGLQDRRPQRRSDADVPKTLRDLKCGTGSRSGRIAAEFASNRAGYFDREYARTLWVGRGFCAFLRMRRTGG
jgi:hypothetical protein